MILDRIIDRLDTRIDQTNAKIDMKIGQLDTKVGNGFRAINGYIDTIVNMIMAGLPHNQKEQA